MEEGAPSPSSRPPLHRPPSASTFSSSAIVPVSTSPLTYIVQVHKDKIYRVPPPENARLAEKYRAKHSSLRSQRAPCLKFLHYVLCVAIAASIPLLLAALVFYITVRPATPTFHISHVVAKPSLKTAYEIKMEVTNPSAKMGYLIEKGGGSSAALTSRGKSVAEGEPPHFYLEAKETKRFTMTLRRKKQVGSKPAGEESPKGSKKVIQLQLAMAMPVRVGIGSLRMWGMKLNVECDVKASTAGKATRVLSQVCEVRVHF